MRPASWSAPGGWISAARSGFQTLPGASGRHAGALSPFPCQNEQDAHLKFSFSHAKQPLHFAPRSDKMKAVHMGA